MINVVYDYQVFSWQQYGGISRYICELANYLYNIESFDVKILAMGYVNQYLKTLQKNKPDLVIGLQIPKLPKTGRIIRNIDTNLSKIWLNANPPHILHQTFYYPQSITPKNVRLVATIHDMLHEKFPQYLPYSTSFEKAETVKRCDHIICISENTKKDLIEILDVEPKKISVIYHGVSIKFGEETQNENKLFQPYILYVGARAGYKNFQLLLQAYAASSQLRNNFNLVCFGGGSFSGEELTLINALELPDGKILYISGNDTTLADLYRRASVFVYPSLYEGFGIPLLEAMAIACPVACSNTSSMPEVVGNAAELFDPNEPESIASALEKVLFSEQRASDLIKLGKERVKFFSWEKCAEQTRQVYMSLI